MITNFEKLTRDLDEEEKRLAFHLLRGFKNYTKKNPIVSKDIISRMNSNPELGLKKKVDGVRLRKMINMIRSFGVAPIIGTSNGYYLSYDKEEIAKQVQSMRERADAINAAANGLKCFLEDE